MPIDQWSDTIWLVKLADEPALSEELTLARDRAALADPVPDIILDCAALSIINSSNLAQLLKLRKLTVDHGSRLRLAAIPDNIWAVFLTTGLDKVFTYEPDVATALAALQLDGDGPDA